MSAYSIPLYVQLGLEVVAYRIDQKHDGVRLDKHKAQRSNCTYEGLLGEWGFARTMGLPFNPLVEDDTTDGGYDFLLGGMTVDVKTTTAYPCRLMVRQDRVTADIYALACLRDETVQVLGWALKEDLLWAKKGSFTWNKGTPQEFEQTNYEIQHTELRTVDQLRGKV